VGRWLPAGPASFPWAVFAVNTAGAFVLALLLVLVLEVLPPGTYLRPLVGTGFCGALTTFGSVAVAADQLVAAGRAALALGYVAASLGAGLCAVVGAVAGVRALAAARARRG
jgi:CrcB protein